ncbi:MAG: helicase, partial [Pseudomonadota bacterium]
MNSTEIRTKLVEAVQLDLVGPSNDHAFAQELLPQSPRRWYLTGFLVPTAAEKHVKSSGDGEMDEVADERVNGADDTETSEPAVRASYLPSSMGLSVLTKAQTHQIEAVIRWGDYYWETEEKTEGKTPEPDEE